MGSASLERTMTRAGVPRGSVLARILFTAYVFPVGRLIDSFDVAFHKYADDAQLYAALNTLSVSGRDGSSGNG